LEEERHETNSRKVKRQLGEHESEVEGVLRRNWGFVRGLKLALSVTG